MYMIYIILCIPIHTCRDEISTLIYETFPSTQVIKAIHIYIHIHIHAYTYTYVYIYIHAEMKSPL